MAWVSIHQQIRDHRKLRDLYRELNVSRQEALGILVMIWTWALDNCDKEGRLLSADESDIAHAAYWKGSPNVLCKALIDTEWLDAVGNELFLHDWYDFNKPFYDYIEKKAKDRKRKQNSDSTEIPRKFHGNSTESSGEFHASPAPAPAPAPAHSQYGNKKSIGRFTPPDLQDVISYCKERKNNVDPEKFVDFYQSKNWMVGKNKMKDWKACIRTWEKDTKNYNNYGNKSGTIKGFEEREYKEDDIEDLYYEPEQEDV